MVLRYYDKDKLVSGIFIAKNRTTSFFVLKNRFCYQTHFKFYYSKIENNQKLRPKFQFISFNIF